ncbi:MAG: hypothetical protein NC314_08455 [Roseburia sp.]|nr:hypothetical protein [Ruminococcus sp.]MCM1155930.1 hypothetical protein [Roseburia sp.]MCM1242857.1 hypothetical protein [Roseburia sp.]
MAIGQIEIQGQITRAQDFTTYKHNEDTKGMVEQANVGNQFAKQIENQIKKVNHGDQPEYHNKKFDAKDKGSNEYRGDGGRRGKKREKKEADGKVLLKGVSRIDISL